MPIQGYEISGIIFAYLKRTSFYIVCAGVVFLRRIFSTVIFRIFRALYCACLEVGNARAIIFGICKVAFFA